MTGRSSGPRYDQGGYSFNELLVAMGIGLTVIMSGALNTASMFRQQAVNGNTTIALQLAQDKLEELQARRNFADQNLCPSGGESGLSASGASGGRFDRCWRIQPSALGDKLKQIDVTVTWQEFQTNQVTLSSLVFTGAP